MNDKRLRPDRAAKGRREKPDAFALESPRCDMPGHRVDNAGLVLSCLEEAWPTTFALRGYGGQERTRPTRVMLPEAFYG